MSYNLLLNTNFNKPNLKHWKLTNCELINGCLVSNDKVFSIQQKIILPKPTKIYFSMDYVCLDSNIKNIYCGVISDSNELNAIKKKSILKKRKKLSLVSTVTETFTVTFIIESRTTNSRIYLDSPLLVDLISIDKGYWPKHNLDKYLDYRYGYNYSNEYRESEISIDSQDFKSPYTKTVKGKTGIIAIVEENDWFEISHEFKDSSIYLVKLNYENINNYGQLYFQYGEIISEDIGTDQLYILFKANKSNRLKLNLKNSEMLPYQTNLKHIMIVDITNLGLGEEDIPHLPFI